MSDHDSSRSGQAHHRGGLVDWFRGLVRGLKPDQTLRQSLEEILEEQGDEDRPPVDAQEQAMLRNLLEFGDLWVDDVMVPRADIVAVDVDTSFEELIAIFEACHHSRLPVYRGSLDEVLGMVHVKDLLAYWRRGEEFALENILRQVMAVPPSMRLSDLLVRMQTTGDHMAIVVDEYGGTDGLVTIEDLVETIVGEIKDEHDDAEAPMFEDLAGGEVEVDARAPVEDVEKHLDIRLVPPEHEEEIDTLGGLVTAMVGRVPIQGEIIRHESGLVFEVIDADPRRVKRLRVRRQTQLALVASQD